MNKLFSYLFLAFFFLHTAKGQEARLLRFPAVHGNQVVFTYAGDLYLVPLDGGLARRITSHPGYEMFAKFSHDGQQIAFTAQYDGNTEVFVMPSNGGIPKRITYTATLGRDDVADRMGPNNVVMGWTSDDQHVIYRTRATTFNDFKGNIRLAPLNGDMGQELPFAAASWISYSPDGSKIAMNRVFREFRTWKYYRGGQADDIWLYDNKNETTENLTNNPAQDIFPMYYEDKVFFFSDRQRTMNLFVVDTKTKQTQQLTHFTEFDCKFPSIDGHIIVFENGGYLYQYNITTNQQKKIPVTLAEDLSSGRNKQVDASKYITSASLSPDGKRVAFGARGDIFTLPAKSGVTRNLTQSSNAHDRNVEWSPDGKWLCYISDRSGEDELYIQAQDGRQAPKQISSGGGSYKFNPVWSPDSKLVLLSDRNQDLYYYDIASGKKTLILHSDNGTVNDYTFSPDSKWIAFTLPGKAREFALIYLYRLADKKQVAVTDQWYESGDPTFSPDGKYLYFTSSRDFNPTYSSTEWNHVYNNMTRPYFVRLAKDVVSPFEAENDEVKIETDTVSDKKMDKKKEASPKDEEHVVRIDEEGLADRIESLPVIPGNYANLVASNEGLYYMSHSMHGGGLKFYALKDKKENVIGSFGNYQVSPDRKKILIRSGSDFFIETLSQGPLNPSNKVPLDGMKLIVDLHAEWKQVYDESWRQMRDYFYDPNMHGVNWKAMHDKYAALLPYVNHRNDLTYIIGELIGELNIGHAYVNSGDRPDIERIPMGLLGARFSRDKSGYYRIDKILTGEGWDKDLYAPLYAPGVQVKEGEFIIAINGKSVKDMDNLYQGLIGQADQLVELEVNDKASESGVRKYIVKPVASEASLYYHDWVQHNIKVVSDASDGAIGYVHIPDMGVEGLNQFARYFYPQLDKKALIIDDRGNGGGNVSPMIIERLLRRPSLGTLRRNNKSSSVKPDAHIGPKVLLIDQYSASDGDLFPYQFKYFNIGPVIGQRSWGGVVGISGSLPFIDGGDMRKPEFAHFAADGSSFVIEGHGVDPDIEVVNDPHIEYTGKDIQLERAIEEVQKLLKDAKQTRVPPIPAFPDKSK
ncbi:S41 family peptidase [Olivibacter ginsenosidimutans]|uniref:Tricorn protease homolog n=1 Tax=Olivibacter ginsenosidimutans TaxID=1176537 RepID=A0ABP9C3Z1_9SPHI